MKSSYVSSQVSKIGDDLKDSTRAQVSDYKKRFDVVKEMYDEFLKDLIVQGFDPKKCYEFILKFFGSSNVSFATKNRVIF